MLNKEGKIKKDLNRFYHILSLIEKNIGGKKFFSQCSVKTPLPQQGLYIIFEPNEMRYNHHNHRVVRVGTHALTPGSKSTLWSRLKSHKGKEKGGGNHHKSVFRRHVGACILKKEKIDDPHWGKRVDNNIHDKTLLSEIERKVSEHISTMSLIWIAVQDDLYPNNLRSYFERNMIGLLANHQHPVDPPSSQWLGQYSASMEIRNSGLWNKNFINYAYDDGFLDNFEEYANDNKK